MPEADWAQFGPDQMASRTPVHGVTGAGGRNRSWPTGGAANGIPPKMRPVPLT
jgi:hypothetical protein